MMKFRILNLFFLTLISAAGAHATNQDCEGELSIPAHRFLRTLRTAVERGDVTQEQLKWLVEQPLPTAPQRSEKRLENFSYTRSFRVDVPSITDEQWPLVIAQVSQLLTEREKGQAKINEAQQETVFIPGLISTFAFPPDENAMAYFVSSKGEILLASSNSRAQQTYLYNRTTGEKHVLAGANNSSIYASDFFETANGEILFAYNTSQQIAVVNARTGLPVMQPVNLPPAAESYAPVIFEELGVPMVVLLDTVQIGLSGGEVVLKVNISTGDIEREPATPYKTNSVLRLPDGHLYAFGVHQDPQTMKSAVVLRDLSLRKDLVHLTDVGSEFVGNFYRVVNVLTEDGTIQPTLVCKTPKDNHLWQKVNPKTKTLEAIPNTALIKQDSLIDFVGTTYAATVNLRDGIWQPVLHNFMTGQEVETGVEFARHSSYEPTILRTNEGILYVVGDIAEDGFSVKTYLVFLDQKRSYNFPTPAGGTPKIFYSPHDRRILMLGYDENFRSHLYQIWGPDGASQ